MKWLCSVGVAVSLTLQPALADDLSGNYPLTPEARDAFVTELLKEMTADEKIGQLHLISVNPDNPREVVREMIKDGRVGAIFNTITRQNIRATQDQVMELNRLKIPLFFAYNVLHGQRTVFPISLGLASSSNLDAVKTVGRISAYEAAGDGLNITRVPMVNVSRDPHWGRASEGFSEDTYLTSIMDKTMAEVMQGKSPADHYSVVTSVKHFATYSTIESDKECNTVSMSPQRLFNNYMSPYKAGLGAGSGAVVAALNSLDGTPAASDSWLLKDVLCDQWGPKGITVSDHDAIKELIKHGTAADPEDAVRVALKSRINMSIGDEYYSKYLPRLIKSGKVTMEELDDAVRHVLNVRYDMELFNDPYSHLGPKESDPVDTSAESRLHHKKVREVARGSPVSLKNRPETLSLKGSTTTVMVGPLVDGKRGVTGSWSVAGVTDQSVTVLTGTKNAVGENGKVLYIKGANVTNDKGITDFLNQYGEAVKVDPRSPQEMIDEAVQTAKRSDVVMTVVGGAQEMAHEASSRTYITIPQSQRDLTAALKTTDKPLVLVLVNGCPLALVKEDQQAGTVLETRFARAEGDNAIADVLFGDYNPSGKLPVSFPCSVRQVPVYYSHLDTGRPYNADKPNKYTSRYFDEANGALYSFGYELSYTAFAISDMRLSAPTIKRDGKATASVQVTNTGKREGATIVQMYLQDVTASMSHPVRQLKGFEKVTLKPGETQTVNLPIDIEALKFQNQQVKYDAEPGKFNVFIGTDSARVEKGEFGLL